MRARVCDGVAVFFVFFCFLPRGGGDRDVLSRMNQTNKLDSDGKSIWENIQLLSFDFVLPVIKETPSWGER